MPAPTSCPSCGFAIEGGESSCHRRFEELTGRNFTDIRYGGVHRMLVDIYALQHPDRYCISAKSLAAHLCGLCDILERGGNPTLPNRSLRAWLDGPSDLVKPDIPKERGDMTLGDVIDIEEPQEFRNAVRRWAESVWSAYRPLHAIARQWLDAAQSGRGKSRHGRR